MKLYYYYQHEASTVHRISLKRSHDRMTAMDLLIEKSKTYGLFETYKKELEFKYAELYLINTLFGHLAGRGKKKFALAGELVRGIRKQFPDFWENEYYKTKVNAEEQKLIRLLMQSRIRFFAYYYALQYYRKLRKQINKKEAGLR